MKKIENNPYIKNIVYISLCLYILDVILLGTGDLLRIGGISSRIVFFAISILGSVPFVLNNLKAILQKKEVLLMVAFGCFVLFAATYGIIAGNYRPILVADIKGYLNILILFPMMYVLSNKESAIKLLRIVLNSIFIAAIVCIVLSYFQFFTRETRGFLYEVVHEIGFASLTILTKTAIRVFLHSGTRMLALGLLLSLAFLLIEENKKIYRFIQMTACVVALYISYARAIYLGMLIMVIALIVCMCIFYKDYFQKVLKAAICVLVCTVIAIVSIGVTQNANLFLIGWNRCVVAVGGGDEVIDTSPDMPTDELPDQNDLINMGAEMDSLELREYRISMALENFSKSPVWGNGLGVVNDLNYYTGIEYFYLDLLSKMGVLGLILFIAPAVALIINIIKQRQVFCMEQKIISLFLWFALLFMMIISYFNPCMNTSWGLMVYGLAIVMGIPWQSKNKE